MTAPAQDRSFAGRQPSAEPCCLPSTEPSCRWLGLVALLALTLSACGGAAQQPADAPNFASVPPPGNGGANAARPGEGNGAPAGMAMNPAARQAYSAGNQAFRSGDLAGARAQFERAVQLDASAYEALLALAVVRERLGDLNGALGGYQQALALAPTFDAAIVAYALALTRAGRTREAEDFLGRCRSQAPRSPAVPTALAEIKSLAGDSARAQGLAREALKLNPDFRPAMVTIARDHYRRRRLDLALYSLKGILDGFGEENPPRDKDNAEALLLRGLIFREQEQRGPAIEQFERALKLRPDMVEGNVQLGAYLLQSGNAPRAVELLERAVRYDPGNVIARLNLGDAYRLLGRNDAARRELEWVKRTAPNLPEVFYDIGLLYLLAEQIPNLSPARAADLAIEAFQKFKTLRPRGQDDVDELLIRAKAKKALVGAQEAEKGTPAGATSKPGAG